MRLKNVLIVVSDMERAIKFYKDLFGLQVLLNQEGNVIMTEGLVLQDREIWEKFVKRKVLSASNAMELYFEEADIEGFDAKLKAYAKSTGVDIIYVNELMQHSWGQKVIRFYDLDGNLIEVGTPM